MIQEQSRWPETQRGLLKEMEAWISASIKKQGATPYQGIHDEGSFTFSWDAYYFLTQDEAVPRFLTWLRDGFKEFVEDTLYHGYYRQGEAHHQPEPFTHFIARFRTLAPYDAVTPSLLDDVAHHIGNWADGVPDWYDWDKSRFRSFKIGSEEVVTDLPCNYEEPDHFRFPMMALSAYLTTGTERYLDLCINYADRWCREVEKSDLPPVVLFHDDPANYFDGLRNQAERELPGRVEMYVSSGALDFYMDLFSITGHERYRDLLLRMVPTLVSTIADPRNRVSAATLAKFRRMTGDTSWDERIMATLPDIPENPNDHSLQLLDMEDLVKKRGGGLGMLVNTELGHRPDQFRLGWTDTSGSVTETAEPTPPAWALAWQITGDERYAARAFEQAAARLRIARTNLEDGRNHGCAGRTIGALASGHGRDDRWGDVNSILGPLTLSTMRFASAEVPACTIAGGVPKDVSLLVRDDIDKGRTLLIHNSSSASVVLQIEPVVGSLSSADVTVAPDSTTQWHIPLSLSEQLTYATVQKVV